MNQVTGVKDRWQIQLHALFVINYLVVVMLHGTRRCSQVGAVLFLSIE